METLEQGKSYSVEELLGFLSDNNRSNLLLQTMSKIDLLKLPRNENFVVTEIQTVYLHRMSCKNPGSYLMNNEYKIYRINQVSKGII
jgi:hypothetical protein